MGPKHYLLNEDHSLRPVSFMEWAEGFEAMDRCVAWSGNADKYVSTVFLGIDHRFSGDGPPLVFETMVFLGETSLDQERYSSWAAAEAGHRRYVKKYLLKSPQTKFEET